MMSERFYLVYGKRESQMAFPPSSEMFNRKKVDRKNKSKKFKLKLRLIYQIKYELSIYT